jgi:hypothetical protein
LNEAITLSFPNGLTLRPMLSQSRPDDFESSTIVSLHLTKALLNDHKIEITSSRIGLKNISISFADYISTIVAGLDIRVKLKVNDGVWITIHQPISEINTAHSKRTWLETISYAAYLDVSARDYIGGNADRLQEIRSDDASWGMATLATCVNLPAALGRRTIGGLSTNVHGLMTDSFIGCLEFQPNSAKRDASALPAAPKHALQKWANGQVQLLKSSNVDSLSWCAATVSFYDLGLDPTDILQCLFNKSGNLVIADLRIIYNMLKTTGIAVLKSTLVDHIETMSSILSYEHYPSFIPVRNSGFLSLQMEGPVPKETNSFLGCLWRYAIVQNEVLEITVKKGVGHSNLGATVDVMLIKIVPLVTADSTTDPAN